MTTRSQKKSSSTSTSLSVCQKRIENSWILLIKESLFENSSFSIVTLPHPAHGNLSKYCLDNVHNKMFEVVTFNEPYSSWFIGDYVKSDGSILMVTPINPLFLVLPRLKEQCANRAVPLNDLLSEKGFDKIVDFVMNMESIGDLKGAPEMKAYKYNEEKTLNWLEERVHKVAKVLKEKNIHVTSGAISSTFVSSTLSNENVDEEFYLKYAHGIISEYLQEDLVEKLEKRFNFKPEIIETVGKKRKSEVDLNNSNKKAKNESTSEDVNDVKVGVLLNGSSETKKKPTAKEKARQKAASGTKTISSFFTKK
ncbi:PREDICTED: ribonuclease H2 subunit B [Papilio polytes]|uniref:ribonuclease H2 subunit B n=1 Tax=Papilio polytes TaxID=76194 RepID=UPI00067636D1|nr:PREDICTED: ribonuclease H2 subunit B [Papilio polytes]